MFSGQVNGSILKDRITHSIEALYCVAIGVNVYGDHCRVHRDRPGRNAALIFNLRLKRCFEMFPLSACAYCMLQKRTDG
jgi:hypothetical protein